MSAEHADAGDTVQALKKQFKKVIVEGGSLKGAHYNDISIQDLGKAARSYRGDSRFQQYAKRMMAAHTLASDSTSSGPPQADQVGKVSSSLFYWCKYFLLKLLNRMKGRLLLSCICIFLLGVLLSRPRLYSVMGKLIVVGIKRVMRHSVGLIAMVFDAFLEEISDQLDSGSIQVPMGRVEPVANVPVTPDLSYQLQTSASFKEFALNLICIIVGTVLGPFVSQHWTRAQPPPDRQA